MSGNLGASDEYGSVDLFGLDEFGVPAGLNQQWGAAIGVAAQTVTAIGIRKFTNMDKYSEGIGALAGAAAGGAMIAMGPGARAAGWTALITSMVSGGLRQLAHSTGMDKGLGIATIEQVPTLGYPTIERQELVPGSGGLSGMPPQLQGMGALADSPGAQQAQLVGGPQISGLATHFGTTLFG